MRDVAHYLNVGDAGIVGLCWDGEGCNVLPDIAGGSPAVDVGDPDWDAGGGGGGGGLRGDSDRQGHQPVVPGMLPDPADPR